MPLILKRWPGVKTTLPRVSQQCAKASTLLQELAQIDFTQCFEPESRTLIISKLKKLSLERRENLLRYWLEFLDFPLPSQLMLNEIEKAVLQARADATPLLQWNNVEIRRYRDALYVMRPLSKHDPKLIIPWDGKKIIRLPHELGIISPKLLTQWQVAPSAKAKYTIRFREGGEKIKLPQHDIHHDLKKLLQEWGIPPWLRDRIALVFIDDELIAINIPIKTIGRSNAGSI
jgi:tRNA(Ile)-lysidine synthase